MVSTDFLVSPDFPRFPPISFPRFHFPPDFPLPLASVY